LHRNIAPKKERAGVKSKISTRQMIFSAGAFIIATSLLTKTLYLFLKHDAWIGVVLGYLISLPVIWIYETLAKRFPAKSLIEINDAVFGHILGKLISALYIFYFLSLACLNTRTMGNFVKSSILPNTPLPVILTLFMIICAWALRKGTKNLTSLGTLFVVISVASLLLNYLLTIKNMKLQNFLPILSMPLKNYFIGAHIVASLPLCEIFVFFMLLPEMQKPEEFGKAMRGGIIIGTALMFFIVIRDIAVLGNYIAVSTIPSFAALRLIDIGEILTRLEVIYAFILIALYFFKVSVLFYASVSAFSRLMKFDSYKSLIYIFGSLIVVYGLAVFKSTFEHSEWLNTAVAGYSTFFLFILPAVTLIVALMRKLTMKEAAKPS
jgi:spore germination protein KB